MQQGNLKSAAAGLLAGITLAGAALAATTTLRFTVNGKPVANALSVDGRVYVPLSVLQANGVKITAGAGGVQWTTVQAAGGANQMTALEGCVGQTLFNGVWRMTVRSVTPATVEGFPGYNVVVEMANGTSHPLTIIESGMDSAEGHYTLATANGDTSAWRVVTNANYFGDRSAPQGGKFTFTFPFFPSNTNGPTPGAPAKFLMYVNPENVNKKDVPYSVPNPSFRVNLTCRK